MYPGDDAYYQCHACSQVVSNPTLLSGNTFGAELYSDGRQIAPMLPEFPSITKCPKCHTLFWLDEGHRADMNLFDEEEAIEAEFLSLVELYMAVNVGLAFDNGRELFLRQRILWRINDRVRIGLPQFPDYETRSVWEENCNAILELIDESKVDHLILKAEILRYFGEFEKSSQLIESIDDPDSTWLVPLYQKAIQEKTRNVFKLY